MSLYWTDKTTGEMIPILEPLRHKPRGKVKRLPSPRYMREYNPPRSRVTYHRGSNPLEHLLVGVAGLVAAATALCVSFTP